MNSSTLSDPKNEIRFHCDSEGRLEQVSLGWVQFVGKSVEEVHGKSWLAYVAAEQRTEVEKLWLAAVEGRGPLDFTSRFVSIEGESLPVTGRLLPCLDTFGDLMGYAAQFTPAGADGEQQELAPDTLTRVLNVLGMAAVTVDRDGKLEGASRLARRVLEVEARHGALVETILPELRPWMSTLADLDGCVDGVLTVPRSDRAEGLTLISTSSAGEGSDVLILLGKAPDLEAQRAHSALEVIGLLAGDVAHKLNNSLAIVDGTAELLVESVEGDAASQVAAIRESAKDGIELTEQLGSLSASHVSEPAAVSLPVLIKRLLPLLRIAAGHLVVVDVDLPHDLPRIEARGPNLERMLLHLVVEMRKRCRKGRFAMTARAAGERVVLSLELDSPEQDGVTWLESLVVRMGSPAGGEFLSDTSSCELAFPRITRSDDLPSFGIAADPSLTSTDPIVRRDGVRVLVAEDERVTRDLISRRLRSAGYAVTVAADGEQALDLFDALDDGVDIVVTDILMPNKDGVSLARELRSRSPQVKLLMISGQKSAADRLLDREVLLVGTPVMQKPFSSEALVHEIRELLERPVIGPQEDIPEEN